MEQNKIIIYQTEDGQTQIDVRMENETVWLTQAQMVELFQTTEQNVSLHVGNVFKEGELEENTTVKEYLTVQKEGKREVNRKVKYYNLDVIISVVPTDEMLLALMEDFAKSARESSKRAEAEKRRRLQLVATEIDNWRKGINQ